MPLVRDLPACYVTEPSRSTGPRFSLQTRARHLPFQPLGGAHLPLEDLSRAPSWEGDGNPCSPPGDIGQGKVPFEIWIILKARDRPLPSQGQPETPWRDEAGLASAPGRLPRGWTLTSRPLPAVNAGLAVLCIRGLSDRSTCHLGSVRDPCRGRVLQSWPSDAAMSATSPHVRALPFLQDLRQMTTLPDAQPRRSWRPLVDVPTSPRCPRPHSVLRV